MKIDPAIFAVAFMAIFFALGLIYKIVADFKTEMCKKLNRLQELFFQHLVCHGEDSRTNREPIK